ncbi:MAG: DEAD/DEAH box helicase family protein, partial [Betaproteobacteria bacterium]|nr:DEAD/DEAH box helicase family protein [Betaproteobacteria bacterium]
MMEQPLFTELAAETQKWRESGYPCDFPLIGEILRFQYLGENPEDGLRFLRTAQFSALETYWYLRLVKNTPHIMDLYREYHPKPSEFAEALGVPLTAADMEDDNTMDGLIQKIKTPEWAKARRLDAVHESAALEYPGYIFALAMGAGKTILIGAIIATEFAMALRHNGGQKKTRFMQNALVFAPGLTIIESLREIADMPTDKILPPRMFREYNGAVKIVYARGGQKEIQADKRGHYHIIVSNNEKINLRAATRKNKNMDKLKFDKKLAHDEVAANARLQTIAGLPNLGVFSDEAHHTYGNAAGDKIKRIRETVNYIHKNTPLVAVINTTGTPYYKSAVLPEVVCWYGLKEGIRDNVLKHLQGGIYDYAMDGANAEAETIGEILNEFFRKYKNTRLQNGARAKIAFYFKQIAHLEESKPLIEKALAKLRVPPAQILTNHEKSSSQEKDDFNCINDPKSQKRVILLVQKGVEGWNCPSLFACALIKEQTTDIFVMQAATRCLRQTPGNNQGASIFLSNANRAKFSKALKSNFGVYAYQIDNENRKTDVWLKIRKPDLPALEITRTIKTIRRKPGKRRPVVLTKPKTAKNPGTLTVHVGSPDFDGWRILRPGIGETIELPDNTMECHAAAARLAANYHLPILPVLAQLQKLYPDGEIPGAHFSELLRQIEKQTADYVESAEKRKEVLALIRTMDQNGKPMETDGDGFLVHRLQFSPETFARMQKAGLIVANQADEVAVSKRGKPEYAAAVADGNDISYHYTPYCLDSAPESDFFATILRELEELPEDIQAFLFTGYPNANLTDFYFQYLGEDGAYHNYFPDFLLLKKSGEFYVVEIKSAAQKDDKTVAAKIQAVESRRKMAENHF